MGVNEATQRTIATAKITNRLITTWHIRKLRTTWVNRVQIFTIHLAHRLNIQPTNIRTYRLFYNKNLLARGDEQEKSFTK
jgi:hypothetical protein